MTKMTGLKQQTHRESGHLTLNGTTILSMSRCNRKTPKSVGTIYQHGESRCNGWLKKKGVSEIQGTPNVAPLTHSTRIEWNEKVSAHKITIVKRLVQPTKAHRLCSRCIHFVSCVGGNHLTTVRNHRLA